LGESQVVALVDVHGKHNGQILDVAGVCVNRIGTIQPIILFLCMAALNVGLWVFLNKDQQQGIHEATSITAKQAAIRLERALAARLSMVGHLQHKWRRGSVNTQADFKRETLDIHETFSGVQAVNRADAEGVIRWVTPARGNSKAIGVNIRSLPTAAVTFEKAKRTGKPQITKTFDLVQGGKGFVVHFPLGAPGKFDGVVAAVFRIRAIIKEALDGA